MQLNSSQDLEARMRIVTMRKRQQYTKVHPRRSCFTMFFTKSEHLFLLLLQ